MVTMTFVPVPARTSIRPSAQQFHNILPLMLHHLGGKLSAALISCSTAQPILVVQQALLYMSPILHTVRLFTQCDVLLFFIVQELQGVLFLCLSAKVLTVFLEGLIYVEFKIAFLTCSCLYIIL